MTISWHRLVRSGQATQRSLFVEKVADRIPRIATDIPASSAGVLVPEPEYVACERDLRNVVFAADHSGALAREFSGIREAALIELARHDFEPCREHDAVLGTDENIDALKSKYGPHAEFSATSLETYAQCPFAYFQDRELRLFAVDPTDELLDARVRGSVVHGTLERFHCRFKGVAVVEIDEAEASATMQQALEDEFARAVRPYGHIAPGLLEAEKARLARALDQYRVIARDKDDPRWKPSEFEVSFGHTRTGRESNVPAFALELDDETVRIAGRIDRVDRDGNAVRLVDYKTSTVAKKEIEEKRNFQLALYALAAESVLSARSQCESASYIAVGKDSGETVALSRKGDKANWDRRIALAREAVAEAIHGIRSGIFHPTTRHESCRRCRAEKVCRYERARMQRKTGA